MILHCPPPPHLLFVCCPGLVLSCPVPQYIMPFCPHVSPFIHVEFFPPVCPVIRLVCRTSGSPSLPPDLPYLGGPSLPPDLPYLGTLVFRHVCHTSEPPSLRHVCCSSEPQSFTRFDIQLICPMSGKQLLILRTLARNSSVNSSVVYCVLFISL
jgi:hypothetical protein